jgi:protein TonB
MENIALSPGGSSEEAGGPSSLSIVTLVLWAVCAGVSALGLIIPYARPQKRPAPPVVQAEIINVKLTPDLVRDIEPEMPPHQEELLPAPPAVPNTAVPPEPARVPVTEASPKLAFSLPVEEPSRIVPPAEAIPVRAVAQAEANVVKQSSQPASPLPAASPTAQPQRLTFGQGEGNQPAPEYPRRAVVAGEEGTAVVRFTVGENGRVLAAEATVPSPWPLLNEAAVRVVRDRWRFRPGPMRLYEVAIRFQLQK